MARARLSPSGVLCLHSIRLGETTLETREQAEKVAQRLVAKGLLKRRNYGIYQIAEEARP